jgi:hypothetical protein
MCNHINMIWYGVTEKIVKVYGDLCPICLKETKPPKSESYDPLQMVISDSIGSWAQMNLEDMRRKVNKKYKWILCFVDCTCCLLEEQESTNCGERDATHFIHTCYP